MLSTCWLIALIILVVIEAATVGLTFIWFAVGALGALILSALGAVVWVQIAAFLALSAATLVLVRPVAVRLLKPGISRTNADRILGQTALVIQEIDNLAPSGQVKIAGQVWTARSDSGEVIPVQSKVRILGIEGVKVIVTMMKYEEA